MPTVLYFGTPLGALYLAQRGFKIAAAVIAPRDCVGLRRVGRVCKVLVDPNLNDAAVIEALTLLDFDLSAMWYYPRTLPKPFLKDCVGIHPSLLPRWRGPDPLFWAIREGDPETGVTAFALDQGYDDGKILKQQAAAIHANDTTLTLGRRLDRMGLKMLADALIQYQRHAGTDQNQQDITYAPSVNKSMCAIRWSERSESIERLVRASRPYPLAWMGWCAHVIDVLKISTAQSPVHASVYEVGEAAFEKAQVVIKTGSGWVRLDEVAHQNQRYRGVSIQMLLKRLQDDSS